MKRILLLVLISVFLNIHSYAQHLTYSDFMRLAKNDRWSIVHDFLSSKGFVYSGKKSLKIVWSRNCTITVFSNDGALEWSNDPFYEIVIIETQKEINSRIVNYYFPFETTYNTFLQTVKNNGYKYNHEDISDDNISTTYFKVNKIRGKEYMDMFIFHSRKNNQFYISYFPPFDIEDYERQNSEIKSNQNVDADRYKNEYAEGDIGSPIIDGLDGYGLEYFPTAKCPGPGTVVVRVIVSPRGIVTKATIVGGSNNNNRAREICINLAKKTRFCVPSTQTSDKIGTITYTVK